MPGRYELAGRGREPDPGALVPGGDAEVRRLRERPDDREVIGRQGAQTGVDAEGAGVAQDREEPRGAAGDRARHGQLDLVVEADVLAARAEQRGAGRRRLDDHRDLQRGVVGLDGGDVPSLRELAPEADRRALEHDDVALARPDRERQACGVEQRRAPDAGADDDHAGVDPPAVGLDRGDAAAAAAHDPLDRDPGAELGPEPQGGADERGGGEPRLDLRVVRIQHPAGQIRRRARLLAAQRVGVEHLAGDAETGEGSRTLGGGDQLLRRLGDDDAALAVVLEVVVELPGERGP